MERKIIPVEELLRKPNLIGGDVEWFWNPDGSDRGRRIYRGRVVKFEDAGDKIKVHCEWTVRWIKTQQVWKKVKNDSFQLSKKAPEYPIEALYEEEDGSLSREIWAMKCVLSSLTFYPKGHSELLVPEEVIGLLAA